MTVAELGWRMSAAELRDWQARDMALADERAHAAKKKKAGIR